MSSSVAYDHVLLRPRERAKRVHWLHLAGFIDHQQIKVKRTRFEPALLGSW
jgi:hypothetical protein